MVNFILMLLMAFQNVSGVELDFGKIYSILTDRCTQCGNESPDVNVLDLSGQELDDISDIQCLLVRKNDKVTMLKNVENLYLKLNNNILKTLPKSLLKLNLIKLNITNNKKLVVPEWLLSMEKKFYIKKD